MCTDPDCTHGTVIYVPPGHSAIIFPSDEDGDEIIRGID